MSPVLDPGDTLRALESGFIGYPLYFVRKWWRSLLKSRPRGPPTDDFGGLRGVRDLRRLTAELIRLFTDFGSLEEYLDGYSITGRRLQVLQRRPPSSPREMTPSSPLAGSSGWRTRRRCVS